MNIKELKESRYLTKEDCPLRLSIKEVVKENVAMEGEDARDKYVMLFNETEKGMVLNSTNGQIMAENFGSDDSDDWTGRRVDLYNDKNVMFAGKRVGGIRVVSSPSPNKGSDKADMDRQEARERDAWNKRGTQIHQKLEQKAEDDDSEVANREAQAASERQKRVQHGYGQAPERDEPF